MMDEILGHSLEACNCHVICRHWFEQDPDENGASV